jgi:hypothetical protein
MASPIQCPLCGATRMQHSRMRGPFERLMRVAGTYYRCSLCRERSFLFGKRDRKPATERASK